MVEESLCTADDILAIPDISVDESEDLPKILQPFVEDAAKRIASAKQTSSTPSSEQLSEAMSSTSQQLQRLKVMISRHMKLHASVRSLMQTFILREEVSFSRFM